MAKPTNTERSTAAKKAAATRKKNEAKSSGTDLKNAGGIAVDAARGIGAAAASAASKGAKALSNRVSS